MGIFFKKQPYLVFKEQDEVTGYWQREGAHNLDPHQIKAMQKFMVNDVTFKITTNFFCKNILDTSPSGKLLDAGCGWGRSLMGLKRKFPFLKITGVDIVEELLELGKRITADMNLTNIDWHQASLMNLSFEDNYFDNIISTRVLHYMLEPSKIIEELLRVLKPGGRMIIIVPNKLNPILRVLYHTKIYSAKDMKHWFPKHKANIIRTGTIGFVPPFKSLRRFAILEKLDVIFQKTPLINNFGGLAFCIVEKIK